MVQLAPYRQSIVNHAIGPMPVCDVISLAGSAGLAGPVGVETSGGGCLSSEVQAPVTRRHRVTHRTEYCYSDTVTSSYGRGFLTPRDSLRQRCIAHRLDIEPAPADISTSRAGYGKLSS